MKYLNLYSLAIILLLLAGCKNYQDENPTDSNTGINPSLILPNSVTSQIVNDTLERIDGFQIYLLTESVINVEDPAPYSIDMGSMAAYNVNGESGLIDYVNINGVALNPFTELFPTRYVNNDLNSPGLNEQLFWETSINNEIILDTMQVPNGFANLSFSSDSLDPSNGIDLNWSSTSNGDVSIQISVTDSNWISTVPAHLKIVPDNGSCFISPSELADAGVDNSTHAVTLMISKGLLSPVSYDNDNKILANLIVVQRSIDIRVK